MSKKESDKQMNIKIGNFIRAQRRSKKLSLYELAQQMPLKITYQQLQKYEVSKNSVSLSRFMNICSALDLHPCNAIKQIMDEED